MAATSYIAEQSCWNPYRTGPALQRRLYFPSTAEDPAELVATFVGHDFSSQRDSTEMKSARLQ
jgi:hypothetical protein